MPVSLRKDWSGRPDLNRGPPAPKPAGLSLGSPSFSTSFLKTNELEKYLVVARCTKMWLRMLRVPPTFPHSEIIAKAFRSVSLSEKKQAFGSELKTSMFLQRLGNRWI